MGRLKRPIFCCAASRSRPLSACGTRWNCLPTRYRQSNRHAPAGLSRRHTPLSFQERLSADWPGNDPGFSCPRSSSRASSQRSIGNPAHFPHAVPTARSASGRFGCRRVHDRRSNAHRSLRLLSDHRLACPSPQLRWLRWQVRRPVTLAPAPSSHDMNAAGTGASPSALRRIAQCMASSPRILAAALASSRLSNAGTAPR